ncbi:MAG: DinB family protein [Actinomycetota bacterium]|nr:DinB family protein [Actinomycetota bacterium]
MTEPHASEPQTPPPDDKDWTWTLQRVCPECGYDAATVERSAVPALVGDAMSRFPHALGRPGAARRPAPTTWSPLEYSCHVRDVCRVFAGRVDLMREQDEPRFADWDQDTTAQQERYWAQDPAVVSAEVVQAADLAAAAFARVRGDDWERRGVRSNGSEFTIDSLARYFLHDLYHHVADLGQH